MKATGEAKMKNWKYIKGSEKDFEGAPDWATRVAVRDSLVAAVNSNDSKYFYLKNDYGDEKREFNGSFIVWGARVRASEIAFREKEKNPKHLMIFGDPKSFIFAHDEATHAAKNKVTGEVVHTHIPGLINLSKFDFIAQRQLADVTESDLNECIGASEAINLNPDVVVRAGEMHFNGMEDAIPTGVSKRVKTGSLHLDGKEHVAPLGNKYMREIAPGVWVDVYAVLKAWNVTNPALQHLIKKALQPGERGHKTLEQDMQDIIDSAIRAKELESK